MTYKQNKELFDATDNLSTFSRLLGRELDKMEPDWNDIERYEANIEAAHGAIYNLMVQCNDLS